MSHLALRNAKIFSEGTLLDGDLLISDGIIAKIGSVGTAPAAKDLDLGGRLLLPGVIDDQVHFREPGLTHKADIHSESCAAVTGGVTSFMEMPNTKPPTLTQELLEEKYQIGARSSVANYSFYMGVSNDNLDEVVKTDPSKVCGVKVFLGSSTGNMLVDNPKTLERLFSECPTLLAAHCESEPIIQRNLTEFERRFGSDIPFKHHPDIRSVEACYESSSGAVDLARRLGTRLHVLHISTAKELELFSNEQALAEKRITAEACIHHLWFCDRDYEAHGARIKWNPAVKSAADREQIRHAVVNGTIDVVATDHAPHTAEEKANPYTLAPSGGPLVQHALVAMLELVEQGEFTLAKVVERMCHAPAVCFGVDRRGFIREGYFADLVALDQKRAWEVSKENIRYKCRWSPFEGTHFTNRVFATFVNGRLAYEDGRVNEEVRGERLTFNR